MASTSQASLLTSGQVLTWASAYCVGMCTRVHVYVCACMHGCVCVCVCVCARVHVCVCVCVRVRARVCVCVCVHACRSCCVTQTSIFIHTRGRWLCWWCIRDATVCTLVCTNAMRVPVSRRSPWQHTSTAGLPKGPEASEQSVQPNEADGRRAAGGEG